MIVETAALPRLSAHETMQVYNGLDCCVTHEVFGVISQYMTPETQLSYDFKRAMQAPALEMMLRGIKVDDYWRWRSISEMEKKVEHAEHVLNRFSDAVWNRPLNASSPTQLKKLFYEVMHLPPQYKFFKGQKTVSTDRAALEKLSVYFHAQPFINQILKIRDLRKKISVLKTEIDNDGRMRTSYNVAGTETDRWSSSKNAEGGGTNLQNITEELRRIFISDEGWKLAYIDLEQAESRAVGWICFTLFGSSTYLNACESGDLHTTVARLIWPHLPWSGTDSDKDLAEQPFYRQFSYRDMSKRGGHGTNYVGTPETMARNLKVATKVMKDFQSAYFAAFPEIKEYHRWCAKNIQLHNKLTTPLGTSRLFFGRPNDDATLREGVAYVPQHMVGVLLNLALWRIWKTLGTRVQILGQVHDAILLQYREEDESTILPRALKLMETPLHHADRTLIIPSDVAVGWNWAKYSDGTKNRRDGTLIEANPDGLRKWRGEDERSRTESADDLGLDQRIS